MDAAVVGPETSCRDEPNSAATIAGTIAAYSPYSGGIPAMVAKATPWGSTTTDAGERGERIGLQGAANRHRATTAETVRSSSTTRASSVLLPAGPFRAGRTVAVRQVGSAQHHPTSRRTSPSPGRKRRTTLRQSGLRTATAWSGESPGLHLTAVSRRPTAADAARSAPSPRLRGGRRRGSARNGGWMRRPALYAQRRRRLLRSATISLARISRRAGVSVRRGSPPGAENAMIRTFRRLFESTVVTATRAAEAETREHGYHVATAALLVEVMRADSRSPARGARRGAARAAKRRSPTSRRTRSGTSSHGPRSTPTTRPPSTSSPGTSTGSSTTIRRRTWWSCCGGWRTPTEDLDKYEEHLVRRIADLIHVPHSVFIRMKHKASPGV